MNIDRDVQRLGGLEDRPEFLSVKVFPVSMGIDDGAFELAAPVAQPPRAPQRR